MDRDPKRIDRIAQKIVRLWKRMPGMRLGQLVAYAASSGGWTDQDTFYVEDNIVENGLNLALNAAEPPDG